MEKKNFFPQPIIQDSIRGVEFDYFYTGRRLGSGSQIELHITSTVIDWDNNTLDKLGISVAELDGKPALKTISEIILMIYLREEISLNNL